MNTLKQLRPVVFCGPSGSGKSTLLGKILKEFPDRFGFSVSHTTRSPRPGEVPDIHYHFISKPQMEEMISRGEFLEHAQFGGNFYGTSRSAVEAIQKSGRICVLDIEMQGVKQIDATDLNPWKIFIRPPSLESLRERLISRKTETEESIARRLKSAQEEIEFGTTPGNFDLVLINDDLERTYDTLRKWMVGNVLGEGAGGAT